MSDKKPTAGAAVASLSGRRLTGQATGRPRRARARVAPVFRKLCHRRAAAPPRRRKEGDRGANEREGEGEGEGEFVALFFPLSSSKDGLRE